MATSSQLVNNFFNDVADTPQVAYLSPTKGNGTIITAITAANNATSNKSYKGYVVDADGSAINPQRPFKIVTWGDLDLATGLDGQVIPPGGTLQFECNATNSVYFTVSGIET